MGKFENMIIDEIEKIINEKAIRQKTFVWLSNKHTNINEEFNFNLIDEIFIELGGNKEGLEEKKLSLLKVDAFFENSNVIVEIDEIQHFTEFRLLSLNKLKHVKSIKLAYDIDEYINLCISKSEKALRKGQNG
ncbi:MAG: hypothetical protein K8R73_11630, partial [Clostridiales bacterium]|nr:hypothetical protein [Clostridiales bacterium]